MRRLAIGVCVGTVVALLVAACGGSGGDSGGGGDAGNQATRVEMGDFSYAPAALTARPGQAVALTIVNNGNLPHNFTIDGVIESGNLNAGASKSMEFTVAQAGTLTFYCTIHGRATMSGTLTVSTDGAQTNPQVSPTATGEGSSDEYYDQNY